MIPAVALVALLAGAGAPATPGETVVREAYATTHGKWFNTAMIVSRVASMVSQNKMETWYESIKTGGFLRIDVAPALTGRATIYRNDSTYAIGKSSLRSSTSGSLPMFVLLYDLHTVAPERTVLTLRKYGFDLKRTHTRVWDGEPVIVVGALAGDTVSNQFWLEKKRMVLVRLIERNGADPRLPLDARITNYQKAGAGWLEHSIREYLGGQLATVQDYMKIDIDKPLEDAVFQPLPYRLPPWVGPATDLYGRIPSVMPKNQGGN